MQIRPHFSHFFGLFFVIRFVAKSRNVTFKQRQKTTKCVLRHLQCSEAPKHQPLKIHSAASKQSSVLALHFHAWTHNIWKSIGLEMRFHKHITHTQRHMNNAWSEMVSCYPCFAFDYFSYVPWFIQIMWDSSYPSRKIVVALI